MYGSRNKCVRLELRFVVIYVVGDVSEWTERQRGLAVLRVRLRRSIECYIYFVHYFFVLFLYAAICL